MDAYPMAIIYGWRWRGAEIYSDHLKIGTVSMGWDVYVNKGNEN